jgi:hypothetical protein
MQTDVFTRNPVLRGYWYAVAQSSDVAPGPLAVTVAYGGDTRCWHCAPRKRHTAQEPPCPVLPAPLLPPGPWHRSTSPQTRPYTPSSTANAPSPFYTMVLEFAPHTTGRLCRGPPLRLSGHGPAHL